MKLNGTGVKKVLQLRRQTEKMLTQNNASLKRISTADIRSLLNEFQIYQIELEDQNKKLVRMQNDLKRAGEALRKGETRYHNLFQEAKKPKILSNNGKTDGANSNGFQLRNLGDEKGVFGKDVLHSIHRAFVKSQQAFRLPL